jgi:hypothetical protein
MDAAAMPDFAANTVRLHLHAFAYNLGTYVRTAACTFTKSD